MASFTLFSNLPVELQLAIWALGVPDPEPEVCIAWPLNIEDYSEPPEEPVLPFLVDTAWPTVAHVCRTVREAVLSSGALRLRHSPTAGLAVPYRHFIPAIDTLYWGYHQDSAMRLFLGKPENALLARDLRHLAVELTLIQLALIRTQSDLASLLRQSAVNMRTLSAVLPTTKGAPSIVAPFIPPARRCKLRDISSDDARDRVRVKKLPLFRDDENLPVPVQQYLDERRWELDEHARRLEVVGDEGTAWSTEDRCFSGLEMKAQTFVEYTAKGDGERWVEVCNDRRLASTGGEGDADWAPEPRRIPVADRKNPEQYRVLDDDSGLYTIGEHRTMLERGYQMSLGMIPPGQH